MSCGCERLSRLAAGDALDAAHVRQLRDEDAVDHDHRVELDDRIRVVAKDDRQAV